MAVIWDRCACGGAKQEKSRQCRKCFRAAQRAATRAASLCACGGAKETRSKQCAKCFRGTGRGDRLCACGGAKQKRSRQCAKCCHPPAPGTRLCACGGVKEKASTQCVKCDSAARRRHWPVVACEGCGVAFASRRGQRNDSHPAQRFCTRACFGAWRRAQCPPRVCETCGVVVDAGRRFCSRACFPRRPRPVRASIAVPVPIVIVPSVACRECGTMFLPTNRRQVYCSYVCGRRSWHRTTKYRARTGLRLAPDHELFQLRRALGQVSLAIQRK